MPSVHRTVPARPAGRLPVQAAHVPAHGDDSASRVPKTPQVVEKTLHAGAPRETDRSPRQTTDKRRYGARALTHGFDALCSPPRRGRVDPRAPGPRRVLPLCAPAPCSPGAEAACHLCLRGCVRLGLDLGDSMAQKKGLAGQGRHQLDVMRIWQWQPHTRPVQAGGDGDDHVCAMQCKPMCRYAIVVQRAAASPSFSPPTGSLETGHRRVHVAAPAPPRATDRSVRIACPVVHSSHPPTDPPNTPSTATRETVHRQLSTGARTQVYQSKHCEKAGVSAKSPWFWMKPSQ